MTIMAQPRDHSSASPRRHLAMLATHPIHYQIQLAKHAELNWPLDISVLLCSRFGLEPAIDHTCGVRHHWYDGDLLEGCTHTFLRNYAWQTTPRSFLGTICPGIVSQLRSGAFDAVLVQGYAGFTEVLAIAAARLAGVPVLFRAETAPNPASTTLRSAARAQLIRWLAANVAIFLPIGTRSARFYRDHGVPDARLVLSPYSIDVERFTARADSLATSGRNLKIQAGLDPDTPVILCVGKLVARKRQRDLLEVFGRLSVPAQLVFVGDGPERPFLEREIRARSMTNVRITGLLRQEQLPAFYGAADVFVMPSVYEPWGLVVNEALCFSLPIVATSGVAAAEDLVEHGRNGFVYESGDVAELERALRLLITNPAMRAEMGQRSRAIIKQWTFDDAAAGLYRGLELAIGCRQMATAPVYSQ